MTFLVSKRQRRSRRFKKQSSTERNNEVKFGTALINHVTLEIHLKKIIVLGQISRLIGTRNL